MTLLRNTFYNVAGSTVPIIVAIITVPFLLHGIGPAKFGLLSLAFLIVGYFGVFDLGLGRAIAHRIARIDDADDVDPRPIIGTAIVCNLALGLTGGLVLWLFATLYFADFLDAEAALREQMIQAIPALVLSVPITALTGVLSGSLEGRGRFIAVNLASGFAAILFHLLPLSLVLSGTKDLQWLVSAACAARILGVLILSVLCVREFGIRLAIIRSEAGRLFSFGGWVAVSSIVGPLMLVTDRFVIGALLGSIAVAIYTIPFEIAARTATIPQALGRALFPQLSAERSGNLASRLGYRSAFNLAALMTPLVIVGIFAMKPFLDLWLGTYDLKSVAIGQITLAAFWVNALSYVPLTFIVARGRPKTVAIVHCLEILPYFAVLYALTKFWGVEGAALAFLLRCGVDYLLLGGLSKLLAQIWLSHSVFATLIIGALFSAPYVQSNHFAALGLAATFVIFAVLAALALDKQQSVELYQKFAHRYKSSS